MFQFLYLISSLDRPSSHGLLIGEAFHRCLHLNCWIFSFQYFSSCILVFLSLLKSTSISHSDVLASFSWFCSFVIRHKYVCFSLWFLWPYLMTVLLNPLSGNLCRVFCCVGTCTTVVRLLVGFFLKSSFFLQCKCFQCSRRMKLH